MIDLTTLSRAARKSEERTRTSAPAAAGSVGSDSVPAGWYPDPAAVHQLRYWDGRVWTEHVHDHQVASVDPL